MHIKWGDREDNEIDIGRFENKMALRNTNEYLWVYSSELEKTLKSH